MIFITYCNNNNSRNIIGTNTHIQHPLLLFLLILLVLLESNLNYKDILNQLRVE